jgi:NAD(P)-dependent dehydrogenase (short-subunit alcohol dehydrogenase family)
MHIVITGAARGIGEATARRLAAAGHRLALGDLDNDLAQRVADDLTRGRVSTGSTGGAGAMAAHLDVTSPDSWREFLAATQELGPIDVLVNNAGIMPLGQILKEPDEVTRKIFDVNVFGIINGTKAVGPGMVDRGRGHIINVASAVGRRWPTGRPMPPRSSRPWASASRLASSSSRTASTSP